MGPLLAGALLALAPGPPASQNGSVDPPVRAKANLVSLFSDSDYPPEAVRNYEQGPVTFRIGVDPAGAPTDCSVISSSGSSILDSTTCRLLMARAHFEPARDSAGKPTRDSVVGRIVWRLPDISRRLETLRGLWRECVVGEGSKLAPGSLDAAEIVRRSFGPCVPLESLLAKEIGESVPLEESRALLAREVEGGLVRVRSALKSEPSTASSID